MIITGPEVGRVAMFAKARVTLLYVNSNLSKIEVFGEKINLRDN